VTNASAGRKAFPDADFGRTPVTFQGEGVVRVGADRSGRIGPVESPTATVSRTGWVEEREKRADQCDVPEEIEQFGRLE